MYISTYCLIPLIPLREVIIPILRLAGAKIGKNVTMIIGSRIIEPYLLEVGDNTQFGGYILITGHTKESTRGSIIINKVRIGNNCLIGAKSYIQPGVTIGDNVTIATKALVPKNKVIPSNTVWGGIPAKKIKDL
jgi:acetyltransferase-like isoleucine patch superfamily enzyme